MFLDDVRRGKCDRMKCIMHCSVAFKERGNFNIVSQTVTDEIFKAK